MRNTVGVTDMPGRSRCSGILARVEHDLHRHALHDLDEVAGRVLRRQQAEARAGRAGDAVDLAVELRAAVARRPSIVDALARRACSRSCVSLKFAVTQTSSSGTIAISGWPAWTTWPGFDRLLRLTMPRDRRLDRRCTGGSARPARARPAPAATSRLGRRGARLGRRDLLRRRSARSASSARACSLAGARLRQPALGDPDAGFGLGDLRPRRVDGGALRLGGRDGRVELLLRDLVLGEQALQPLDVARGLGRVGFRLAQPRLRRDERALAPPRSPCSAPATPLCACSRRPRAVDTLLAAVVEVIGTLLCGRDRARLGVGELGARAVDRDLVVARIDLRPARCRPRPAGCRRPRLWGPCRRRAPRSASRARRPAHRR